MRLPLCALVLAAAGLAAEEAAEAPQNQVPPSDITIREVEFEREVDFSSAGTPSRETQRLSLSCYLKNFPSTILGFDDKPLKITGSFAGTEELPAPRWFKPSVRVSESRSSSGGLITPISTAYLYLTWSKVPIMPAGNEEISLTLNGYKPVGDVKQATIKDIKEFLGTPLTFPGVDGLTLIVDAPKSKKLSVEWIKDETYEKPPFTSYRVKFYNANESEYNLSSYSGSSSGNSYTRTYSIPTATIPDGLMAKIEVITDFEIVPITFELPPTSWQYQKPGKKGGKAPVAIELSPVQAAEKPQETLQIKPVQAESEAGDF